MSEPKLAKFEGKCSKCGRIYYSDSRGDIAVCDCWRYCPICGAEMMPYTSDFAPKTYGKDGKRDMQILIVCNNTTMHPDKSPFYSHNNLQLNTNPDNSIMAMPNNCNHTNDHKRNTNPNRRA